jgi:hypothetical protein
MPCTLADKCQCDGGPFTKPQRITSQTTVIWLSSWEHRTPYPRPSYRKITFHLVPGTIWSAQVPRHINCAAKFCTGALSVPTISAISYNESAGSGQLWSIDSGQQWQARPSGMTQQVTSLAKEKNTSPNQSDNKQHCINFRYFLSPRNFGHISQYFR